MDQNCPPAASQNRLSAPSVRRNRGAILDFLKTAFSDPGSVLEVGSGTGEHAAWFAPRLPHLTWQPTEPDPQMRASISAWSLDVDAPNLLPPVPLDVTQAVWPPAEKMNDLIAIFASCVIHIAPWAVTEGLMHGADRYLPTGGKLCFYGPFALDGEHTAESNARFDASLQSMDPSWGVRDLTEVTRLAENNGLVKDTVAEMPADNLCVVFRRR